AVRVERDFLEGAPRGGQGLRRRAERILVGGELHDAQRVEAELPRDLPDRLPRLVDRLGKELRLHEFLVFERHGESYEARPPAVGKPQDSPRVVVLVLERRSRATPLDAAAGLDDEDEDEDE